MLDAETFRKVEELAERLGVRIVLADAMCRAAQQFVEQLRLDELEFPALAEVDDVVHLVFCGRIPVQRIGGPVKRPEQPPSSYG